MGVEEEIRVFEIIDNGQPDVANEVIMRGQFSTNSAEDLSCGSTEGVYHTFERKYFLVVFERIDLLYLTSDMRFYEESFQPDGESCLKLTNCFDFAFPIAQSNGSASEFIETAKPDIDALDLELEISESTVNDFGIGVGAFDGGLVDFALFELKQDSEFKYKLSDENLQKLKDYFNSTTSPLFYITLYDIYRSSVTTPQFSAVLKLKTSDQESCLNSNTCLLFRKSLIGNQHPLQSSRLYYWTNY